MKCPVKGWITVACSWICEMSNLAPNSRIPIQVFFSPSCLPQRIQTLIRCTCCSPDPDAVIPSLRQSDLLVYVVTCVTLTYTITLNPEFASNDVCNPMN